MGHTSDVLERVMDERLRQDFKWGKQSHADYLIDYPLTLERDMAIKMCNYAFQNDKGTWCHILVEEVTEAIEEAKVGDLTKLKEELIQVSAVAVAWIEEIERRDWENEDAS